MDEKLFIFMGTVDERFRGFVSEINEYLTENGCKCDVKLQKSGYVVSYVLNSSKRTLATFISRKTGMKLRIYPEHIQEYQSFLDTLPEKVKKDIKKASVCKRLINPGDCNPKCTREGSERYSPISGSFQILTAKSTSFFVKLRKNNRLVSMVSIFMRDSFRDFFNIRMADEA